MVFEFKSSNRFSKTTQHLSPQMHLQNVLAHNSFKGPGSLLYKVRETFHTNLVIESLCNLRLLKS